MSASTNPDSILYAYLETCKWLEECCKQLEHNYFTNPNPTEFYVALRFYDNCSTELDKRLTREPFPGYEVALENFLKESRNT